MQDVHFLDRKTWYLVAGFGAFAKTKDGGETWAYQNLSEKYQNEKYQFFYSVAFVDSLTGWIVGGDYNKGYIVKTADGGENWIEEPYEIKVPLREISFANRTGGWTVGVEGLIYRTKDGGGSWISQRDEKYGFSSIYFIDDCTGWVVGERGVILHTEDGGSNWHRQNQNDSLEFSSIYAIDNQKAFAVGSVIKGLSIYDRNGVILKTTNGGQMWARQTFNTLLGFNSIVFVNDSIGWISEANGTLLKTVNKGATWNKINLDTSVAKAAGKIQFINKNIGWIGGRLKTIDGGKTWMAQTVPLLSLNSF